MSEGGNMGQPKEGLPVDVTDRPAVDKEHPADEFFRGVSVSATPAKNLGEGFFGPGAKEVKPQTSAAIVNELGHVERPVGYVEPIPGAELVSPMIGGLVAGSSERSLTDLERAQAAADAAWSKVNELKEKSGGLLGRLKNRSEIKDAEAQAQALSRQANKIEFGLSPASGVKAESTSTTIPKPEAIATQVLPGAEGATDPFENISKNQGDKPLADGETAPYAKIDFEGTKLTEGEKAVLKGLSLQVVGGAIGYAVSEFSPEAAGQLRLVQTAGGLTLSLLANSSTYLRSHHVEGDGLRARVLNGLGKISEKQPELVSLLAGLGTGITLENAFDPRVMGPGGMWIGGEDADDTARRMAAQNQADSSIATHQVQGEYAQTHDEAPVTVHPKAQMIDRLTEFAAAPDSGSEHTDLSQRVFRGEDGNPLKVATGFYAENGDTVTYEDGGVPIQHHDRPDGTRQFYADLDGNGRLEPVLRQESDNGVYVVREGKNILFDYNPESRTWEMRDRMTTNTFSEPGVPKADLGAQHPVVSRDPVTGLPRITTRLDVEPMGFQEATVHQQPATTEISVGETITVGGQNLTIDEVIDIDPTNSVGGSTDELAVIDGVKYAKLDGNEWVPVVYDGSTHSVTSQDGLAHTYNPDTQSWVESSPSAVLSADPLAPPDIDRGSVHYDPARNLFVDKDGDVVGLNQGTAEEPSMLSLNPADGNQAELARRLHIANPNATPEQIKTAVGDVLRENGNNITDELLTKYADVADGGVLDQMIEAAPIVFAPAVGEANDLGWRVDADGNVVGGVLKDGTNVAFNPNGTHDLAGLQWEIHEAHPDWTVDQVVEEANDFWRANNQGADIDWSTLDDSIKALQPEAAPIVFAPAVGEANDLGWRVDADGNVVGGVLKDGTNVAFNPNGTHDLAGLQWEIHEAHPDWTVDQVVEEANDFWRANNQGADIDWDNLNLAGLTVETPTAPDLSGYYINTEGGLTNGTTTYNSTVNGWYYDAGTGDILSGDYTAPSGEHKPYYIDEMNGGLYGQGQRFVAENSQYMWNPRDVDALMHRYIADHPGPFDPNSHEFKLAILRAPEPDFVVVPTENIRDVTVPGNSSAAVEHLGADHNWYSYREDSPHTSTPNQTRYDAEPIGVSTVDDAGNRIWFLRQVDNGEYVANINGNDVRVKVDFISSADRSHSGWSVVAEDSKGQQYVMFNDSAGFREVTNDIDFTMDTFTFNNNEMWHLQRLLASEYGLNPVAAAVELFNTNVDAILQLPAANLNAEERNIINYVQKALESGSGYEDVLMTSGPNPVAYDGQTIITKIYGLLAKLDGHELKLPKLVD